MKRRNKRRRRTVRPILSTTVTFPAQLCSAILRLAWLPKSPKKAKSFSSLSSSTLAGAEMPSQVNYHQQMRGKSSRAAQRTP